MRCSIELTLKVGSEERGPGFRGSLPRLQALVSLLDVVGTWEYIRPDWCFEIEDGARLIWSPAAGTLHFAGDEQDVCELILALLEVGAEYGEITEAPIHLSSGEIMMSNALIADEYLADNDP
jgi:hypothetical protein